MPWKVAMFNVQNAIKTFMKGITWDLVHTFFRGFTSTYIPFLNLEIWGIFCKNKKGDKTPNFQKF